MDGALMAFDECLEALPAAGECPGDERHVLHAPRTTTGGDDWLRWPASPSPKTCGGDASSSRGACAWPCGWRDERGASCDGWPPGLAGLPARPRTREQRVLRAACGSA